MSELTQFRKMKDEFFREDHHSPLTADQKPEFSGLVYFPENTELDLWVEVETFDEQNEVQILTNTGDVQTYIRFGQFEFEYGEEHARLTLYANEHGYFLPFADSLAGTQTYGAGRYLEPEEGPDGRFHVNFNLAYNPYCAYNEYFSCPITPAENRLKIPIPAGEKIFQEH
jgi:uncharacterized protein (DUF1684 family)